MFARFKRKKLRAVREIAPEEIFLDSTNLSDFNVGAFEGRVERPVANRAIFAVGAVFVLVSLGFGYRAFSLQVAHGATYESISVNNTLSRSVIFSTRGIIFDRTGRELAWNEAALNVSTSSDSLRDGISATLASTTDTIADKTADGDTFALRKYTSMPGMSHILGFVQYPKADAKGQWWREEYTGVSGLELAYDARLAGANGSRLIESDALGHIERENIVSPAVHGEDLHLSIDADVTSKLNQILSAHAETMGFKGGAAVIMDVRTGELLALTSFPEYDNQAFTDGDKEIVRAASQSGRAPMLNRAVGGLYTPGSIVKPVFAIAALQEGIISPDKGILSTGKLVLPNPYDPDNPSIFRDWTVHGWVDMRTAIAVSSDEYFYTIGGGFGGQKGLGISKIDQYSKLFGMEEKTGIDLKGEVEGIIPTPEWKERIFGKDDPWRIGNTYHTAIGQFGFQITPLQAVRFTAAIANNGKLLKPQLLASSTPEFRQIDIPASDFLIAREGMRMAVVSDRPDATVKALNIGGIKIAAKTGTAQLGSHNEYMNSWSVGFWPADNPKYAYAVVLEKAPAHTASGAAPGLQPFFYWLVANHPEYVD
jgi:penicillin-binding protein 2